MEDPKSVAENSTTLRYAIIEKNQILVVSFTGEFNSHGLEQLESCRKEILAKKNIKCVVLYFQQVEQLSTDVIPYFAQLQRNIRSRPSEIRLCGLKGSIRERLLRTGVIRGLEVTDDLKSALLSFSRAS